MLHGPVRASLALIPLLITACLPAHEPVHKGGIFAASGEYSRTDEDLIVFDTVPLVLRRVHISGDRYSRSFGIGASHAGEWYLSGNPRDPKAIDVVVEDGVYHFDRVSPGRGIIDGVFEHHSSDGPFRDSRIHYSWGTWVLDFADGSAAIFKECSPLGGDTCSLIEMRDAHGYRTRYMRDGTG